MIHLMTSPPTPGDAPAYPLASARIAWILFDCAAQPFFTLVTTFVFGPFFAAAVAANPTEGQALWGYATGAAGLVGRAVAAPGAGEKLGELVAVLVPGDGEQRQKRCHGWRATAHAEPPPMVATRGVARAGRGGSPRPAYRSFGSGRAAAS